MSGIAALFNVKLIWCRTQSRVFGKRCFINRSTSDHLLIIRSVAFYDTSSCLVTFYSSTTVYCVERHKVFLCRHNILFFSVTLMCCPRNGFINDVFTRDSQPPEGRLETITGRHASYSMTKDSIRQGAAVCSFNYLFNFFLHFVHFAKLKIKADRRGTEI